VLCRTQTVCSASLLLKPAETPRSLHVPYKTAQRSIRLLMCVVASYHDLRRCTHILTCIRISDTLHCQFIHASVRVQMCICTSAPAVSINRIGTACTCFVMPWPQYVYLLCYSIFASDKPCMYGEAETVSKNLLACPCCVCIYDVLSNKLVS